MGGNFRSGRAGGCGNPQAQINLCFISRFGASRQCEALFFASDAPARKIPTHTLQIGQSACALRWKRSDKSAKSQPQVNRRSSISPLCFRRANRLSFRLAMGAKNGRVFCACARFAASSPLRRIFYRTARTTVSDCRRRRVLRTLQALHVGRRLVWSELRRGFSRTSRP